jgi:hypothetical protein
MKLEFSRQIFEKYSNIKFHENPSGGSRVVQRGWAGGQTNRQTYGRTDMTKLTVAFSKSANAPKTTSRKPLTASGPPDFQQYSSNAVLKV